MIMFGLFDFGGRGRIRTIEVEDNRFTVCPLWPLGNSPIFSLLIRILTVLKSGAGGRTRTPDLLITNQLLYQLSYTSKFQRPTNISHLEGVVKQKIQKSIKIGIFFILRGKIEKEFTVGGIIMRKKLLSIFICMAISATAFLFAGCGGGDTASVYFLNFKPESADVYEEIAKIYEQETGIPVKVVTAAANTYEQTLKSEIAKSNAPTIFQVNGPIGYESWKNYCEDISDSKLYSYLSDKSLAIKGDGDSVYAVPYVVEGYGIIYNDAICRKYFSLSGKVSELSDMSQVKNFEQLKTIVEDMTTHKSELGIEGVFASTSLSSGEDWRWQTHLLNVPLYYEFKDNDDFDDPTLAGLNSKQIAFRYSENFRNLFDLYINNSITPKNLLGSKSTSDSMAEFALGKVAMVQNGNWAWSQISGVEGNVVSESDIKFLPLYSGTDDDDEQGLCIGTENYFAINSKASDEDKKASLDFLDWLFSSETGKKIVTEKLNFLTPFNTFSDEQLPNDPLAKEVVRYMRSEEYDTVPWIFTSFPSDVYKTEVGNALLEYVQGNKSYDEVKKTIIDTWKSERG